LGLGWGLKLGAWGQVCLPDERVQVDALQRVDDDLPRLEQPVLPRVGVHEDEEARHGGRGAAAVLYAHLERRGGVALLVHARHRVRVGAAHPHLVRVRVGVRVGAGVEVRVGAGVGVAIRVTGDG
jgi:hypothetical protein